MQDKIKSQLNQLKEQGEKLQANLNQQLESAKTEGRRILGELGADVSAEKLSLSKVAADIREANPSLKQFVRNLDVATYDNRFRLAWNSRMSAAYARLQANKTFSDKIEPRLNQARDSISNNLQDARETVEAQLQSLQSKARELRSKIAGQAS
jgi:chromosome segregation ATPase